MQNAELFEVLYTEFELNDTSIRTLLINFHEFTCNYMVFLALD